MLCPADLGAPEQKVHGEPEDGHSQKKKARAHQGKFKFWPTRRWVGLTLGLAARTVAGLEAVTGGHGVNAVLGLDDVGAGMRGVCARRRDAGRGGRPFAGVEAVAGRLGLRLGLRLGVGLLARGRTDWAGAGADAGAGAGSGERLAPG